MQILPKQDSRVRQLILAICGVALFPHRAMAQLSFNIESYITATSIEGLLVDILEVLIVFATPIVVLFIIYGGFLYVTAQGNPEQIKQATRTLTYAIIGGVLIIGAVALSEIIKNIVTSL